MLSWSIRRRGHWAMTKTLVALAGGFGCAAAFAVTVCGADGRYTIGYATFAPLNTAIFIADGDGRTERMLVPDAMFDSNPSFSTDGRWVLFSSRRRGSVDIYRVRVDGTHLERLTDDVAFDDQPVMSPDGRHVAFVSSRSGQADIWLLDLQTRGVRNLTNHPGGDYRPAFSPDGKWIAFTSDRDSDGGRAHTGFPNFAPGQRTQLYVMRADGSDVGRVTQGDMTVGGASWSPDSKALAFFEATVQDWLFLGRSFRSPVVVSQIGRVDVQTGARTLLTTGPGRKLTPQWLSDGRIAYVRSDTEEERSPGAGGGVADPISGPNEFALSMAAMGQRGSSWACIGAATGSRWSSIASSRRGRRRCSRCSAPIRSSGSSGRARFRRSRPTTGRSCIRPAGLPLATLPTTPAHFLCTS